MNGVPQGRATGPVSLCTRCISAGNSFHKSMAPGMLKKHVSALGDPTPLKQISGIAAWLNVHKVKNGTAHTQSKGVMVWLFSKRLGGCEWLFDMFYVERQHQIIRAQAELVKNTSAFESSVLFRVVDAQCESLRISNPMEDSYQLVGRRVPVAGAIVGFLADACVSGGNANTHEY